MATRRESLFYVMSSLCAGLWLDKNWLGAKFFNLLPPNDLVGGWYYRSFLNDPQKIPNLNALLFGEGDFMLDESPLGRLSGTGDFGGGDTVRFQGTVLHGSLITIRFQATGTGPSNGDWLYDYLGILVPRWPNGVAQVPSIVGTVVRSAPHSNGAGGISPAGTVASFIAVKK